ncbi:MAG: AraC family transcriptional regulator, partial [Brevinematales bacterium]
GLPEILKLTSSPDRSQSEWRIETETGFRLLRTQVFFIRDHQGNINGKTLVINETFVKSVKYYSGRQDLLNDLEKIENIMDKEKPYLDPEFTLQDLADMADIPRNRLSWILNKQKKQSFYDFLNLYRINEAKRLMITGEFSNILKIAYNSGFKSKSTFYSSFKRITTKTPSEYLSGLKKI